MSMKIAGIIPVAGLSSRMKDFKPLMSFNGATVIENTINCLLEGGAQEVIVITGHRGAEIESLLAERYGREPEGLSAGNFSPKVRTARNEAYASTDMMHSIKLGCKKLLEVQEQTDIRYDAFFLLPGDMPLVSPKTLMTLAGSSRAGRDSVIFPSISGRRKHPPLIGTDFVRDIIGYGGENGLRGFWEQISEYIFEVETDDGGVTFDLDTPGDYARAVAIKGC